MGRSADLRRIEHVLHEVANGTLGLVFIEGEPGIGKSTLLAEVARRAGDLGFVVYAARAGELEQGRPFGVIAEALQVRRSRGDDARRAEIAGMLDAPPGEQTLYRLVDRVEDLVEAEALVRPVLVSIDDLHWADAATLRVLAGICRGMRPLPVAIVASLRRQPRDEASTALLRATSSQAVHLTLRPLDDDEVTVLTRIRLGSALSGLRGRPARLPSISGRVSLQGSARGSISPLLLAARTR